MQSWQSALIGIVAALIAANAAAQVILYEREGLRGRSFVANRAIDNLDPTGFNDRTSSVVVQSGGWEV